MRWTADDAYLLAQGSGDMMPQLLPVGLVDKLRLLIYPFVLGRWKRLFGDNAQASSFMLANSISAASEMRLTRYVAGSGEVQTGSF